MKNKILCRPRGGLNDTLVQIAKCWDYAELHCRELWIDTTRNGLLDDFSNYFELNESVRYGVPTNFDETECFPKCIKTTSLNYQVHWSDEKRCIVEKDSGIPVTFDFNEYYSEELIIHEQSGGGRNSLDALKRLDLKKSLKNYIKERIERLRPYDAIHIRNTDYQTNYKEFFEEIKPRIRNNLVLCTDDRGCQEYARNVFGRNLILNEAIPDTNGKTLHNNQRINRLEANNNAFLDLFTLVYSENLFYTKVKDRPFASGFSILAHIIRSDESYAAQALEC